LSASLTVPTILTIKLSQVWLVLRILLV
jgi:hypothetical protein